MRDERTNEQLKIELLSQWKLEAEFRNKAFLSALFLAPHTPCLLCLSSAESCKTFQIKLMLHQLLLWLAKSSQISGHFPN